MNFLHRYIISILFLSVISFQCTRLEQIGEIQSTYDLGESEVFESEVSDSDRIDFFRMPFFSYAEAGETFIWISAGDNPLGLQGQWYYYSDLSSVSSVSSDGQGGVCIKGEIIEPTESVPYPYAGGGFNFCNNGPDIDPYYKTNPAGSCLFTADLEQRLLGISFEVTGTMPIPFTLLFQVPSTDHPAYVPVEFSGPADYFFKDALISEGEPDLDVSKVTAFQFQASRTVYGPVPFDFCIKSVELLIAY